MKKVDKIVLKSFLGPFFLTMLVVIFILLTQHMLKYFDDLVGKDLGWDVLGTLIFYFAIFVTPFAFPLGVLLSSLMTFGNLGEHSELTAIKSGGISLPRTMRSIFIFVILLTGVAFVSNNYFVPKAALQAYSLMWDIKRKKPSLDLPEGEFYGGLENYRIRVAKKVDDGELLQDVIIYDHTKKNGNKEVTIADSGRMTTIMNERYLKLELYSGHSFMEGSSNQDNVSKSRTEVKDSFSKVKFDRSVIIFDLSSFDLERTDKELFSRNRLMRNLSEIVTDVDSLEIKIKDREYDLYISNNIFLNYYFKYDSVPLTKELRRFKFVQDSVKKAKIKANDVISEEHRLIEERDSLERLKKAEEDKIRLGNKLEAKKQLITPSKDSIIDEKNITATGEKPIPKLLDNSTDDVTQGQQKIPRRRRPLGIDSIKQQTRSPLNVLEQHAPPTRSESSERLKALTISDSLASKPNPAALRSQAIDSAEAQAIIFDIRNFMTGKVESDMNKEKFLEQLLRGIRTTKFRLESDVKYIEGQEQESWVFLIQYHKILANSFACIVMFLIGAPLGSIIKKGGLGIPVLISILFFIIYYVVMILGEKWAKTGLVAPWLGIWQADLILLPFGIFFLIQAQRDARLFDMDFYNVYIQKTQKWIQSKKWYKSLLG